MFDDEDYTEDLEGKELFFDNDGNEITAEEHAEQEKDLLEKQRKAQEAYEASISKLIEAFGKGITREAVEGAARIAAEKLAESIRSSVQSELKTLVSKACGLEVQKLAKDHMRSAIADVMARKIVQDPNKSWDQTKISIAELVRKEMTDAVQSLRDDRGGRREATIKEAINAFMSKEVAAAAQAAVQEFKQDTMKELSKETMKMVIGEVSRALGSDPKFMKLLEFVK